MLLPVDVSPEVVAALQERVNGSGDTATVTKG
jgi:hypothetical protein